MAKRMTKEEAEFVQRKLREFAQLERKNTDEVGWIVLHYGCTRSRAEKMIEDSNEIMNRTEDRPMNSQLSELRYEAERRSLAALDGGDQDSAIAWARIGFEIDCAIEVYEDFFKTIEERTRLMQPR